jgi:type IV secretory pathway TrbD component
MVRRLWKRGLAAVPVVAAYALGRNEAMDSLTWIGLFGLTVLIVGVVAATFFAKRNDEMQSGGHH